MRKLYYGIVMLFIFQIAAVGAWASKEDCGEPPNIPAKPATKVKEDAPNVQNDYDTVIEEEVDAGVVYLTVVNGNQPTPNACGLNPSGGTLVGWGGPLDADNMTIGEGAGTRNDIVIGGTLFERGIGSHAPATFIYPLTGANYVRFEGYVGMSDEKDPAECDHGGSGIFIFEVDGKEMFESELLKGTDVGVTGDNILPVEVAFDIPAGAKELFINFSDGGDGNSCDHACMGDGKLLTSLARAVEPGNKATTVWGRIKASY